MTTTGTPRHGAAPECLTERALASGGLPVHRKRPLWGLLNEAIRKHVASEDDLSSKRFMCDSFRFTDMWQRQDRVPVHPSRSFPSCWHLTSPRCIATAKKPTSVR